MTRPRLVFGRSIDVPARGQLGRTCLVGVALCGVLSIGGVSLDALAQPPKTVTVGVLTDGPLPQPSRRMLERIKTELQLLVRRDRSVGFPKEWERVGDWSMETARKSAQALLASPAVSLIIAVGPMVTAVMARQPSLSKPVFAPLAIDPRFSGLPEQDGKSGKDNFSYLVYQANFAEDIKAFCDLVRQKTVYLLYDEKELEAFPRLEQMAVEATQVVGAQLVGVGVATSAKQALERIPRQAKAVFVTPLVRMSTEEKRKLYAGLEARRLPSFTTVGRPEIKLGAMATQTRGVDYLRIARRTALNIERTLGGENPSTFPVHLRRSARLILNMATAKAVGFSPDWETLIYAELENEGAATAGARRLTLGQVMHEAVARNWDLAAAREGLLAGQQRIRSARSQLFPQLGFSFEHQTVRSEVANASLGSLPQHQGTLAGRLSQVLYNEPALAGVAIEKRSQRARQAGVEALKLDVVAQAADAYLDLLRAQTTAHIQKNNALLTAEYLEATTIRRKLGAVGPSDVYRWESQIATDRQRAVAASAEVKAAQALLGQLIQRPQDVAIQAQAPTDTDPTLLPRYAELDSYLRTPQQMRVFANFVVQEGLDAAPELRQLRASIAARRCAYQSRARALYLPQVRLQGELSYVPYRKLGASAFEDFSLPLPDGSVFEFPQTDQPRLSWVVGGALTLPLFTGLQQIAERERARSELRQAQRQLQSAKLKIESRIRVALARARAAFVAIRLARQSAKAAEKNLNVISSAYDSGVANTVTLLDAQNNALNTKLAASTAVFSFLRAIVQFQRATGRFELFVSARERDAWFKRLADYFARQSPVHGGAQ